MPGPPTCWANAIGYHQATFPALSINVELHFMILKSGDYNKNISKFQRGTKVYIILSLGNYRKMNGES